MRKLISHFGLSLALSAGLISLMTIPAFSSSGPAHDKAHSKDGPARQEHANNATPATEQSAGEQKFKQNCSRCHRSPEGFSPHISGTILRHMRVRASLSAQDERDILHFLNP